jgi:hypothetical protein
VLYLVTGTDPTALALVASGAVGYICQPGSNLPPPAGRYAFDNGCYPDWTRFPQARWLDLMERYVDQAVRCLFVVLPDVPFDHAATLARSLPWADRVRGLGYRPALAMQNGAEHDQHIPWDAIDVAFLAGDTAWKIGQPAHRIAVRARENGKWVHMGRVNSLRRLRRAAVMGCDSADGTFLRYGPRTNVPRMLRWLDELANAPTLPLAAS